MENIIKKAIEGGYKIDGYSYLILDYDGICEWYEHKNNAHAILVLDPLFWQALESSLPKFENEYDMKSIAAKPRIPAWRGFALGFHEINLAQGWDEAVTWLHGLLK